MGLLSFAAAGVDKLRILVDSEHRERLEAEDAKCTMFDSEEQAWHVDTASVQRGGRWRKGQGSNADNLSGRLFDIFLLNERRKKCRYSCSHHPVLKRSVKNGRDDDECVRHHQWIIQYPLSYSLEAVSPCAIGLGCPSQNGRECARH